MTRFEVVCVGYEPEFWRYDPGPGRRHTLEQGDDGCCNQAGGARTSSRSHIFRSHLGNAIRVWETKTGQEVEPIHGPFDRIRKMAELDGVLWVSTVGRGLHWVAVP